MAILNDYSEGALFAQLNFRDVSRDANFKEDSVREVIIAPLLEALGYSRENIERSKRLQHPFLQTGSTRRPVTLIPDYLLHLQHNYAWVLDAKAPREKVTASANIQQVYSYAVHPEIRSKFFCLCNGLEFALYRSDANETPLLHFALAQLQQHWPQLRQTLAIDKFHLGKQVSYQFAPPASKEFHYSERPLLPEIAVKKRAAKRHFGVHGYFTKQSWNVVAAYINNYSQAGDLVLDPYGGSGVTAIEAMMNGRRAITIDLNPLAVFLSESLVAPADLNALNHAYEQVVTQYKKWRPQSEQQIAKALQKYPYPQGWTLPKGSDVAHVDELFSRRQLAELALLKHCISGQKDKACRQALLLMFSGLITRHNLTYHTSKHVHKSGGGNAAPFLYYRYRIAPRPTPIDLLHCFALRYQKVLAAKRELAYHIDSQTIENLHIRQGDASDLNFIASGSVDYIYTDPPYGKKIAYLDLSAMWCAWLDLPVTAQDYAAEAIEGGQQQQSKEQYKALIAQSIKEMARVLKWGRWLSFVFAHKDPEFWHLIVDTAEQCGLEYRGAVSQKNGQTSFKKRQNPFTVLSGQLIINFYKAANPRAILKANLGLDIADIIVQSIEGIIAKENGATLEQINDELIIKGLELGFLDLLKKQYQDLTPLLESNFAYDRETQLFTLKQQSKFKTHIDLNLRLRYYLQSYLTRQERQGMQPHFDDIVLHILPLLKNGSTPREQTILRVLQDLARPVENGCWRLHDGKLL